MITRKDYAKILVRLGIVFVFLWFGLNQLIFPEDFMGYLPNFLLVMDSAKLFVLLNGAFEVAFGLLLLVGFFTRTSALILGVHLLIITFSLGYNDIAIRDLGLTLVTFSIVLGGADKWCLDYKLKKSQ